MPSTNTARLLADLGAYAAGAGPDQRGALWRLAEPARQLDANLVHLPAGGGVQEHQEDAVDVLLLVVAGGGTLQDGTGSVPLGPGALAWLPSTARRGLSAGDDGLVYLTVHRRRAGLTVTGPGRAAPAPDEGGDDACWLHRICQACGAVPDSAAAAYCSRCGEPLGTG